MPGDRTLAVFMKKQTLAYSTYNYGVLDTFDGGSNNVAQELSYGDTLGEWVYVYMGYHWKLKRAYGFARFMRTVDSVSFTDLNHYVPNQFYIYVGNDRINPEFVGTMQNFNFHAG